MYIKYKIIEQERVSDAPFVGALISAIDCSFNCKNCFNQHIKQLQTKEKQPEEIIKIIKNNAFNKGVIFAGLEWSLQINEAISLAKLAEQNGLKTMLYTGHDFCELDNEITKWFDYIKCGKYQAENTSANHIEYGVVLASANQHIYKKGVDY